MDFVYELKNFVSPEYCKYLINKFENDEKYHTCGRVINSYSNTVNENIKRTKDLVLERHQHWKEDVDKILEIMYKTLELYIKHISKTYNFKFSDHFSAMTFTSPVIQKTTTGGYFKWHTDSIRNTSRLIACIIYLNDVEENCGGRTEFIHKKIQPTTGTIIFFPSTWEHIHCGETLTKGKKYIISGFLDKFIQTSITGAPFTIRQT